MSNYQEIMQEISRLEREAAAIRSAEKSEALKEVRRLVGLYGMTEGEVFGANRPANRPAKSPVAPKYRNPQNNETWTGRGRKPLWVVNALNQGATMEQFLIS